MSRNLFIRKVLFVFLLLVFLCAAGFAFGQDEDAEDAFYAFLDELEEDGLISLGGHTTDYGDYENEWAQINYYQWLTFEHTNRFVFSANIAWESASATPNNFISGCGVVFNSASGNANHLLASVRMDGFVYIDGFRNYSELSYGKYGYGRPSTKGSADFVLVVNEDKAAIYLDGQRVVQKANLAVMGDGVGVATLSGTNKDFGTRCNYKDIFFYTW